MTSPSLPNLTELLPDARLYQLGSANFTRGQSYWKQGRVSHLVLQTIDAETFAVHAEVKGSANRFYEVDASVFFDTTPPAGRRASWPKVIIEGECSCPVGFNCKHVIATLLAAREQNRHITGSNTGKSRQEQSEQYALEQWLQQRQKDESQSKKRGTQTSSDRLLFILNLYTTQITSLAASLHKVTLKKDGSFGKGRAVSLPYNLGPTYGRPAWISSDDVPLLLQLQQLPAIGAGAFLLADTEGMGLLKIMLATGRCHWQTADSPPLRQGDPVQANPCWISNDEGQQQLQLLPGATLLPTTPPCVLDLDTYCLHPLESDFPPLLATQLTRMPALSNERLWQFIDSVRPGIPHLPMPTQGLPERIQINPVPVLSCSTITLSATRQTNLSPGGQWRYVELFLDYAGTRVAASANPVAGHLHASTDGHAVMLSRQTVLEQQYINALGELLPLRELLPWQTHEFVPLNALSAISQQSWIDFVALTLPQLQAEGWRCENLEQLGITVETVHELDLDIESNARNDWFDISLDFDAGGVRVNLLPLLRQHAERVRNMDPAETVSLPDPAHPGQVYRLPVARAQSILNTLSELFDQPLDKTGRLRLSAFAALRLSEMPTRRWNGGAKIEALIQHLKQGLPLVTVQLPAGFNAALRPYQQQGVQWLQTLRNYGLHGLLADDMGLGKTVQTLAHISMEHAAGHLDKKPVLIVCPTSLLGNWKHEAARFAPALRVLVHHGTHREQQQKFLKQHDLVITSYALLTRDSELLAKIDWHLLVLDEAQAIKNPQSKLAESVRQISAHQRICLTGTPMENHLGELWAQMDFLLPGLLGSAKNFQRQFRKPIEEKGDNKQRNLLTRRIAPFLLRRNKREVAQELPEKMEILRTLTLGNKQRDLYETVRIAMQDKIQKEIEKKGFKRSQIVILDALLKLRQVCCDPRLLKLASAKNCKNSAKLEFLRELLPSLVEEGRRILLFSQFTGMLDLIEAEVQALGIAYVRLDGSTRDRTTPVQRFQRGEVPLFLISLKAGGVGLNLTAADTVIHYDPWWNPAVENQATDRAHRIGQDKAVFVYKLISEDTVEEKILSMQQKKQALADGIYRNNEGSENALFDAEDLKLLLQA